MKTISKMAVGLCLLNADSECMLLESSKTVYPKLEETRLMRLVQQQVDSFLEKNSVKDISSFAKAINETYHRHFFIKGAGVSYREYRDYLARYLLNIYNSQTVKDENLNKCAFVLKKILKCKVSEMPDYQLGDFSGLGIDSTTLSSVDIW